MGIWKRKAGGDDRERKGSTDMKSSKKLEGCISKE
jgi:hypothetical protein